MAWRSICRRTALIVRRSRVWNTGTVLSFRIRGDVFNVFNWDNWNDYDPMGAQRGLAIRGPTRYFKLSFGVDW